MPARSVEIADAIVSHLAAQPFDIVFTAQRGTLTFVRQEEVTAPVILVSPVGIGLPNPETRKSWNVIYQMGIVVMQAMKTQEQGESDDMILLTEQTIFSLVNSRMNSRIHINVNDDGTVAQFEEGQFENFNFYFSSFTLSYKDEVEVS